MHLAHKAEHAVDLESGALLAVTLQSAADGDTKTVHETLAQCGVLWNSPCTYVVVAYEIGT